jgi:hypothetical protein
MVTIKGESVSIYDQEVFAELARKLLHEDIARQTEPTQEEPLQQNDTLTSTIRPDFAW